MTLNEKIEAYKPRSLLQKVAPYALAGATALGASQQVNAGVTLYEGSPQVITVDQSQAVGSSPQAMMKIDDIIHTSTGAGTSVEYDANTFEFLRLGNVGGANGLDYHKETNKIVGCGIGGEFGYGTVPDTTLWTILQSQFQSAQSIAAAKEYVLVVGQTGGVRGLRKLDYNGNTLGYTDTHDMLFFDVSHQGNEQFMATWLDLVTSKRHISQFQYTVDSEGEIHLVEGARYTVEGFDNTVATKLGVHKDPDSSDIYVGINNGGNLQIIRGSMPTILEDCAADFNGDGSVGSADLGILLGSWGKNGNNPADLNGDGMVNAQDLGLFLGAWGPCPDKE